MSLTLRVLKHYLSSRSPRQIYWETSRQAELKSKLALRRNDTFREHVLGEKQRVAGLTRTAITGKLANGWTPPSTGY